MISVVLLSGGTGSRMHQAIPKQYMLLAGKPVIMHSLERLGQINDIEEIIIVCAKEFMSSIQLMIDQYGIKTPITFALAGSTRQESVLSGLSMVKTPNVLIHEAARPFVKVKDFQDLIASEFKNVTYGLSIPFTVVKGDDFLTEQLKRDELRNVQLPQKFCTEKLLQAHLKAKEEGISFTEDATLLHHFFPSERIKILEGKEYDIKMTTRMDLLLGKEIYEEYFVNRK